jgi:transcriptional regulator with XRE-family HTH domain
LAANERREILGTEIRRARQAKGLSQERLGFQCGLSRNYLSMVELGQSSPTFEALERICDALDLSVSELVSRYETAIATAPPKRKR